MAPGSTREPAAVSAFTGEGGPHDLIGFHRSDVPISDGSSDEWWQRLSGGVDGF